MFSRSYAPIPMVPGPVTLHPKVLKALHQDYGSGQIEGDFLPLYAETARLLQPVFGTKNDIVFMTGEGMLALWAGLKSCLKKGDRVLCLGNGVFGDGIGPMAASFGCEIKQLSFPYDTTFNQNNYLDQIEDAIRTFKPHMITAVHCETPSGTLNPIVAIGELKQKHKVPLLYVDAVASAGGVPILADAWHIDLLLVGSQKCLSAPPSMSILGVSPKAWEIAQKVNYEGYDALLPFKTIMTDGRCPYTPYWHGVAALYAAAVSLHEEGLENVFTRHMQVAEMCREELQQAGIALFPQTEALQSPTVTAALVPETYTFSAWQKKLRELGLIVAGSFGPMQGKVFRLGHMGTQADKGLMQKAIEIIKSVV